MSEHGLRIFEREPDANPLLPTWLGPAMDCFREQVTNRGYPCTFGRRALIDRELWLTWVSPGDPSTLPHDLSAFLDTTLEAPGRQPLAVFVEPTAEPRTHEEYDELFWSLLQCVHDHDDRPWPADVPEDPHEEGWQFCFHGTPMFVFALVPTNVLRRSRNVGDCLVILFVPKYLFGGIEVGTSVGNSARIGIRKRLERWDAVPMHPSLGSIDVFSEREWEQYVIPDDDSDMHDTCPLVPNAAGGSRTRV
jgi:FPC/CPF motif-containing protein YcgG